MRHFGSTSPIVSEWAKAAPSHAVGGLCAKAVRENQTVLAKNKLNILVSTTVPRQR